MFENLSQRERILSWLVIALVPIALGFLALNWYLGKIGDYDMELMAVQQQVGDEETRILRALKAKQRLDYYRNSSLPGDSPAQRSESQNSYHNWLLDLAKKHGLKNPNLTFPGTTVVTAEPTANSRSRKEIGVAKGIKLTAVAGLEELTHFLHEFYSLGTLHKINVLRITPETTKVGESRIRTGMMSLNLEGELLTLSEGTKDFDFSSQVTPLSHSIEDYQSAIVGRNIFGPPNNAPRVTANPRSSYASQSELEITLRGEDADKNDLLAMELLESGIEGAKLETRDGSRDSRLVLPPTAAGTYEFKVAIKDNGFPAKESDATFEIVIKDPPNNKPSLAVRPSNPYPPDRPLEILIEGSDRDENDVLTFEILEGVEGAELVKAEENDRNVILHIPALDIGKYQFRLAVSDGREENGEKAEKVERGFEVVVARKFSHLDETRISSILRDGAGDWVVNIRVRTTGQRFSLKVGESFEIEKQTWIVDAIESDEVTFKVGEETRKLKPTIPFSTLVNRE